MKILLACAGGMSTGMLVKRMKEYAEKSGITAEIDAYGLSELDDYIDQTDVILLGPQIGYQLEETASKYAPIPVAVIDMMDYGMMDGKKVFDLALKMMRK